MSVAESHDNGQWDCFLHRVQQRHGQIIDVAGNEPVLLDDDQKVWIICAGRIDVFFARMQDGALVSARRHLFRAESGQALFGMNLNQSRVGLLATGGPGTQLIELQRTSFEEIAREPDSVDCVASLLDSWISGLSSGITHDLPPRTYQLLEPNEEITLSMGQIAHSKQYVLWVHLVEGSARFSGRRDMPLQPGDDLIPISSQTWLQAMDSCKLCGVDTRTAIEQRTLWPNLQRFHRLILDCVSLTAFRRETLESNRIKARAGAELSRTDAAFSQLAAVLQTQPLTGCLKTDTQNPLLTACQFVADRLGFTIQPSPDPTSHDTPRASIQRIAQASRVRTREVALRGEWWKADGGPLIGFIEEEMRPVALLPARGNRYELWDPIRQARTRVSVDVAATLSPFAFAFYRPFPDRPIRIREVVDFGLRGARHDLLTVLLMAVGVGLVSLLTPVLMGATFDRIIPAARRSELLQVAMVLGVSAIAVVLFQAAQDIAILRLEARMEFSIQSAVFDRLLSLPAAFFRGYSAGDLGVRALGVSAIRQMLSRTAVSAGIAGMMSIFSFALLFFYSAQLAWIAVVLVAIFVSVIVVVGYTQVRYERALTELQGKISGTLLQLINGIAKLRVAGAERRAFAYWAGAFSQQRKLAYKARTVRNRLATFSALFSVVSSMTIFGAIALSGGDNRLSTGSFLAFNFAFTQFLVSALALGSAFTSALQVVPIFERAKPILQTLPEVNDSQTNPGELSGDIEVNSVSFRYSATGPLILNNVSFAVRPGQFVALVGPSGSGKSTMLRLLLGFEMPESGAIFYDRQELTGLDIRSVRRQIGVVLQSSKLMTGDILANIIGTSSLTVDDAWAATRMAGLEEDIKQMPMGMQTVISEGGGTLSGGQRQRLMIARAIVNKPRIIFFDEATSALDNRTQEIVSRSLKNLEATRVVIAHRLSTIMHADQILVMHCGQLVQSGTYDELINRKGLFADLAKRQLA
jgi:NHLM bacteriocin system ABC transporter ATP-binding protein